MPPRTLPPTWMMSVFAGTEGLASVRSCAGFDGLKKSAVQVLPPPGVIAASELPSAPTIALAAAWSVSLLAWELKKWFES